jgi:hypothetical protein
MRHSRVARQEDTMGVDESRFTPRVERLQSAALGPMAGSSDLRLATCCARFENLACEKRVHTMGGCSHDDHEKFGVENHALFDFRDFGLD